METIELKDGWLTGQMEKVHREVQDWPKEVKMLGNINAPLVYNSERTVRETLPVQTESSQSGSKSD